jgi:hypothetical protein
MKNDIIVKKAKKVIKHLGLVRRTHLKNYTNYTKIERYSENDVKKCILKNAENDSERNYLFIEKVLKQINLFLL